MAIKPRPYKLSCARCGWSKTFAPQSDAMTARDYPHACPKCNAPNLKMSTAFNPLAIALASLNSRFGL